MILVLSRKKKVKVNLNDLAVNITRAEGMKKQVNIAQTKEVLRCTLQLLRNECKLNPKGFMELILGKAEIEL